MHNPFANVRITGTWEDHASYSAGGTDLPLGYGTPIPAPASGILRNTGGSGEWACGWIGTAGRRSILSFDTPIHRHSARRSSPFEAEGPMVAIVFQHQSQFGDSGWHPEGDTVGVSGASASGSDWGGDVHLHWHGLDANGNRLRVESFLPSTTTAGSGYTSLEEYDMTPEQIQTLNETHWMLTQMKPVLDALNKRLSDFDTTNWAVAERIKPGVAEIIAKLDAE